MLAVSPLNAGVFWLLVPFALFLVGSQPPPLLPLPPLTGSSTNPSSSNGVIALTLGGGMGYLDRYFVNVHRVNRS